MPSLLDLPLELRYPILEFAIKFADIQPPDPLHAGSRVELHDMKYESRVAGRGIKFPKRRPSTLLTPLLLVNRQIHNETLVAVHQTPPSFELDIMIVNENKLFPTWIYVPPFKQNVENLYITIRTFGSSRYETNGFSDTAEGHVGDTIMRFYSVLERFAFFGAGDQPMTETRAKNVRIDMLDLNFITPTVLPEDGLAPKEITPDHLALYRSQYEKNSLMHPEALLYAIHLWMGGICRVALQDVQADFAHWGILLLRCIGTVRFMLDGEVKEEINIKQDLGDALATWPIHVQNSALSLRRELPIRISDRR
jgi:hypothetical protein